MSPFSSDEINPTDAQAIGDWLAYGQPHVDDGIDLFPSERG